MPARHYPILKERRILVASLGRESRSRAVGPNFTLNYVAIYIIRILLLKVPTFFHNLKLFPQKENTLGQIEPIQRSAFLNNNLTVDKQNCQYI